MFVTNWNSTTKIQKISEITNFFRHYFLSRTEVYSYRRGEALAQAQGGDYRALCDSGTSAEELQGSRCASGC